MKFGRWRVENTIDGSKHLFMVNQEGNSSLFVLKLDPIHVVENIVELLGEKQHPNILRLIDYSLNPSFTVSEYCELGDLESFDFKGWDDKRKLDMCKGIFTGVEFIHDRGFNKHDNNPKNIFIKSDGTAVIGDLDGLQKIGNGVSLSRKMGSVYRFFIEQLMIRLIYLI